jgi:hypothetical protein
LPHRRTRLAAWGIILTLAAFQAYANRYAISPDGVSYLDLSDAVVTGRLGEIVNLYWSPLYPFLVGLTRLVTGAGPRGEVAAIHATNVVCFGAMFAAFDYFVIQAFALSARRRGTVLHGVRGTAGAYGLFGAVALTMTPLELTTPDWLSNAAIFLVLGAMLRLHDPAWTKRRREAVIVGVALGVGALAKAFLVPWAVVCFILLAFDARKRSPHEVLIALIAWVVIVGPWTGLLSARARHFTTGEAGRLTYAWYVNGQDPPSLHGTPLGARNAQAEAMLPGTAVLPSDAPGTDPMWFDPARWNAGMKPMLSLPQQLESLKKMTGVLVSGVSVLLYIFLLVCVAPAGSRRAAWADGWVVVLPALAGMGAYAMVLLTSRYIMAFILALVIITLAALPVARRVRPMHVLLGLVLVIGTLAAWSENAYGFSFVVAIATVMLVGAHLSTHRRVLWAIIIPIPLAFSLVLFSPGLPALTRLWSGVVAIAMWAASRGAIVRGRTVRFARGMYLALALSVAMIIGGRFALRIVRDSNNASRAGSTFAGNPEWLIAQDLAKNGITPGTRIALIGPHAESYWARTARLKIVANVPDPLAPFWWFIPQASRDSLLRIFTATGAQFAILTRPPPAGPPDSAWKPLRYKGWMLDLRR